MGRSYQYPGHYICHMPDKRHSGPGTDAMTTCMWKREKESCFCVSIRWYQRYERESAGPVTRRMAYAGTAMICDGYSCNFPFPRVKGGYCGYGLGSLVTCRRLLSVSRCLPKAGLGIPVPGSEQKGSLVARNTA